MCRYISRKIQRETYIEYFRKNDIFTGPGLTDDFVYAIHLSGIFDFYSFCIPLQSFCIFFKKHTGHTPKDYRQKKSPI